MTNQFPTLRGDVTNRLQMTAIRAAVLLVAAFIGIAIWQYLANLKAIHKAEGLLEEVRSLDLDQSTASDVERTVNRFGAVDSAFPGYCDKLDSVQSVEVSSPVLNQIGRKMPSLRWFGNSVWEAQAHFAMEQGRLCFIEYKISANPSPLTKTSFVLNSTGSYGRSETQDDNFSYGVGLRNLHYFHDLSADDRAPGNAEHHQHVFDFDLSCLSRFGGCRGVCELMPSAWLDYQKEAKEKGWDVPADELANPRCHKP